MALFMQGVNQMFHDVNGKHIMGTGLTIIGHKNIINGTNCTVIGNGNDIYGTNARVTGDENVVDGTNAKVIGHRNKVSGTNASVEGDDNRVHGTNASAKGIRNTVTGTNSTNISTENPGDRTIMKISDNRVNTMTINGQTFRFSRSGEAKRQRVSIIDGVISIDNGTTTATFPVNPNFGGTNQNFGLVNPPPFFYSPDRESSITKKDKNETATLWEKVPWYLELNAEHDQPIATPESACIICLENAKKCFITPCKHSCLCIKCSIELYESQKDQLKCPICRKLVTQIDEIFT